MPPSPILAVTWYGPRVVPGSSGMSVHRHEAVEFFEPVQDYQNLSSNLGLLSYLLVRWRVRGAPLRPVLLGTLLSAAFFTRPTAAAIILPLTVYVLARDRRQGAWLVSTGAVWVLAPLAVDQAAVRCSCGHENVGNSASSVSTVATRIRRVIRRAVKMSLKANRVLTRPACMAGVLVSNGRQQYL